MYATFLFCVRWSWRTHGWQNDLGENYYKGWQFGSCESSAWNSDSKTCMARNYINLFVFGREYKNLIHKLLRPKKNGSLTLDGCVPFMNFPEWGLRVKVGKESKTFFQKWDIASTDFSQTCTWNHEPNKFCSSWCHLTAKKIRIVPRQVHFRSTYQFGPDWFPIHTDEFFPSSHIIFLWLFFWTSTLQKFQQCIFQACFSSHSSWQQQQDLTVSALFCDQQRKNKKKQKKNKTQSNFLQTGQKPSKFLSATLRFARKQEASAGITVTQAPIPGTLGSVVNFTAKAKTEAEERPAPAGTMVYWKMNNATMYTYNAWVASLFICSVTSFVKSNVFVILLSKFVNCRTSKNATVAADFKDTVKKVTASTTSRWVFGGEFSRTKMTLRWRSRINILFDCFQWAGDCGGELLPGCERLSGDRHQSYSPVRGRCLQNFWER